MAFLGIFIFVGCVAVGPVFADLRNKKETARKNPTVSRQFYCTGDIIRIIPIRCVIRKKYSDGRPFKSHLKRISPEVLLFCIEAKMAIFSRKQCSSKKPHYAYIFCRFPKEMFCPLGASLRSAWESVRFASERSRVRIPLGPPICRIVLYDAAFFMAKNLGGPCRAPNPEVGCEPGGVINVLFENSSDSRFFLCILQNVAGKRIAFMPPSRKFLQKFPHHRRLIQP